MSSYSEPGRHIHDIYISKDKLFCIQPELMRLRDVITPDDLQKYCDLDLSSLIIYINFLDTYYILNHLHPEEEDDNWDIIKNDINEKYTDIVNQAMTKCIIDNYVNKCEINLYLSNHCEEIKAFADYVKQLFHSPIIDLCTTYMLYAAGEWKLYTDKNRFLQAIIKYDYVDDLSALI